LIYRFTLPTKPFVYVAFLDSSSILSQPSPVRNSIKRRSGDRAGLVVVSLFGRLAASGRARSESGKHRTEVTEESEELRAEAKEQMSKAG
jgi:hypothetical protein